MINIYYIIILNYFILSPSRPQVLLISADGQQIQVFRPNRGKGKQVSDTPLAQPAEQDAVHVSRVIFNAACVHFI